MAAATRTAAPASALVVGPLPPPLHGGSVATSLVLRAGLGSGRGVLHLDTTDRRGLDNIGRADLHNVRLATRHAAALLRMLLQSRPRIVYIPIAENTLAVLRDATFILPALALRRRVVLHVHSGGFRTFYERAHPPVRWLVRFMLRRVDRVIVLGESLRPMLAGLTPPERIAVLPNGADDMFGRTIDRSERGGTVRLLYLTNLRRAKGLFDLLEAFALLRDEGLPVQLDLAGAFSSGGDREAAAAAIERLGGSVRVHGVVDGARKRDLLERADVFVLPSHAEGHPYVVLEAMSASLPVVATSCGAIPETVLDGETGVLVPPHQPRTLADALRSLAADPARRLRMGAAGRRRFEQHYSFDRWAAGLQAIVRGVVA